MVNFYVNKILNGSMKLEDVPPRWREEVGQRLNKSE